MVEYLLDKTFKIEAGNFIRAGEVSSEIKKILQQIGIQTALIRRATIASYEGEMNMICYSVGGEIRLFISADTMKIELEDRGPGIKDINKAMTEGFSTATDAIREMGFGAGMGLPNIKRNSDRFNIDSTVGKGTKLEIILDLIY